MRALLLTALALTACRPNPEKIDEDGDGAPLSTDCDDADAAVGPEAAETCNGKDDDCNVLVDDIAPGAGTVTYADEDGDGYGRDSTAEESCEAPEGRVVDAGDCDDFDADRHPGAEEADCTDPTDYNCDGATGFADSDGDGRPACEDCDDADGAVHAGAVELCNGKDDDCDGDIDGGAVDAATWFADADADGYGTPSSTAKGCEAPAGYVADATDCDDAAASVNPAAAEICNGTDDDCNGEADTNATDAPTWYADVDGDGAGGTRLTQKACAAPEGYVSTSDDCDDLSAATKPGATEACDGKDNDCDGALSADESDGDGDGLAKCKGDCDDADPKVRPGADEHCDGKDENCNGSVDENAIDQAEWYYDADGDGHGNPAINRTRCTKPTGYVASDADCDDTDKTIYEGATQVCSEVDHDCDGVIDGDLDEDGDLSDKCGGWDCDDEDPDVTAADCIQPTCKDYRAAGHTTDGEYDIDPDGPSTGKPPYKVWCDMDEDGGGWQRCASLKNGSGEDIVGNTWFDACVTASMASHTGAEVRFALHDGSGKTVYDGFGNRVGSWTFDQLTSTQSPGSQYHPASHDRMIALDTGDRLQISGRSAANSGCHGSFGNGYGVTVYPSSASLGSPKLFVGSHMQTLTWMQQRQFTGWTTAHEIAWNGSPWNSCGATPSFLGTFEFYVR